MAVPRAPCTCSSHLCPVPSPSVSPEAVAVLSAVGAFIVFMLLLFVYINRKFCTDNVGGFPEAGSGCVTRRGSQDTQCEYPCPSLSPLSQPGASNPGHHLCGIMILLLTLTIQGRYFPRPSG